MAGVVAARIRAAVASFLSEHEVQSGRLVIAAVSGGQDSVCLLDSLNTMRTAGLRLAVLHVNHGLRSRDAEGDAVAVERLAVEYGCDYLQVKADVEAYSRRHGLGLEESGRNLRYQALAQVAAKRGAAAAATGHTLDDLAETVLLNLIRGTGLLGTRGISADHTLSREHFGPAFGEIDAHGRLPGLRVIRPLLRVRREDTERYCRELGLEFRTDRTNLDPVFARNRIRHHLIPLLRSYNPAVADSLAQLAQLASDDEHELERAIDQLWSTHATVVEGEVSFEWATWNSVSVALQRRLLRRARRQLGADRSWSFRSLEAARELLVSRPASRQVSLGGGVILRTTRRGFRLNRKSGPDWSASAPLSED